MAAVTRGERKRTVRSRAAAAAPRARSVRRGLPSGQVSRTGEAGLSSAERPIDQSERGAPVPAAHNVAARAPCKHNSHSAERVVIDNINCDRRKSGASRGTRSSAVAANAAAPIVVAFENAADAAAPAVVAGAAAAQAGAWIGLAEHTGASAKRGGQADITCALAPSTACSIRALVTWRKLHCSRQVRPAAFVLW